MTFNELKVTKLTVDNELVGTIYSKDNPTFGGRLDGALTLQSPRADAFYSRTNTSYYIDPSGRSYMNDIATNIIYDRNDLSYYIDPNGKSSMSRVELRSCTPATIRSTVGLEQPLQQCCGEGVSERQPE